MVKKINLNKAINITSWLLILFALGVLVFPFLTNITTYFKQKELAKKFEAAVGKFEKTSQEKEPEKAASARKAAEQPIVKLGEPIGIISIPKIGLRTFFVEGTTRDLLKGAPGHISGTALPGENGNTVISGHRTTYGAFFYRLDELAPGDIVQIILSDQKLSYKISSQEIVWPNNTDVLKPTPQPTLTLTTCFPKYSAKKRLIVKAVLD